MHVPAWPVLPSSTLAPDALAAKFASRSLAGLGVLQCDELTCWDEDLSPPTPTGDSSSVNLCSDYPMMPGCPGAPAPVQTVTVSGTPGYVAPSPNNSAQWAAFATQMLKSGMQLAQIQSIQPGTVVSANGAILRQSPGFAVPVTSSSTNIGLKANTSTTTLIVAGLAVAAVLFLQKGGGR